MESRRILVSGFPVGITELDLLVFFQSERDSGGGDVETVEIVYPGSAVIVFTEPKVININCYLFSFDTAMIPIVRNCNH